MPKFDYKGSEYSSQFGGKKFYRDGFEISQKEYEKAYRRVYGSSYSQRYYVDQVKRNYGTRAKAKSPELSNRWKKQLWSRSEWKSKPWSAPKVKTRDWLKPLTLDKKTTSYRRIKTSYGNPKALWGAKLNQRPGAKNAFVLNGAKAWIQQIQMAQYMLRVQSEHFRIAVGQRALKIFQLSFKYHKFYNEGTGWPGLASYTMKKRMLTGTWRGSHASKLVETGALSSSLTNSSKDGSPTNAVITGPVNTKRVKISVWDVIRGVKKGNRGTYTTNYIYAGIHNEGVPKGRKRGGAIPKRQFMGWSSPHSLKMDKIDTFAYEIADRYLLDSVFMDRRGMK